MNYKMIIQYEGTRYDGWQRQGNTSQTIQGKIESVLERLCGEKVEIDGAGRTDAGVHAVSQVANVRMDTPLNVEEIKDYLNRYLPEDIGILQVQEVSDRFHSRLNARGKVYEYRIGWQKEQHIFDRKFVYLCDKKPNVEVMRTAAKLLVGTHDFKSFCTNKRMKKSTVRTLHDIQIRQLDHEIKIVYYGDGFLYNMVRILTGTLLEVGFGKRKEEEVLEILKKEDRTQAGFTAPACGLCLKEVEY